MIVFILLIILRIYLPWLNINKTLSSGDWPYLFAENIKEFSFWPQAPFLWLEPYYQLTTKLFVDWLGFSWSLTERIFWFWPFLIIGFFSSQYLAKIFFKKNILRFLTSLVFLSNTYILMIVGGGQMGVAMAYALAPLVLGKFINLTTNHLAIKPLNHLISLGLILALQLMFDPRITAITLFACGLYLLFKPILDRRHISDPGSDKIIGLVFSLLIAIILNLFWILPVIKDGLPQLEFTSEVFTGAGMAEFLSFATFSNTLSLLHPNWPENIFGKVYFMRPEFLVIPILAFSSLLFVNAKRKTQNAKPKLKTQSLKNNLIIEQSNNETILFFGFLALIGAFLAKGASPPFGGIYLWFFENVPGFFIFRDPTKFYLLIVLAYMILIPCGLSTLTEFLNSRFKLKNEKQLTIQPYSHPAIILFILFIVSWLLLIRPAVLGQLGGTFKSREIPHEYLKLKDFLVQQEDYFVTFWLPQKQRFGFSSQIHPAITSQELPSKEELIEEEVKYVIVPFDSEGEIFLDDRKYSEKVREKVIADLKKVEWLKRLETWKKIAVYEIRE